MDLPNQKLNRFSIAIGLMGSVAVHAVIAFALIVGFSNAERAIFRVSNENRENLEFSVMNARDEAAFRSPVPQRMQTARPLVTNEGKPRTETATTSSAVALSDGGGSVGVGEREKYLADLASTLNQRLEYPRASQRLRESGRVVIRVLVKIDGSLVSPEILMKSSFARLNEAALKLARDTATFRPIPKSILKSGEDGGITVDVPIDYILANE